MPTSQLASLRALSARKRMCQNRHILFLFTSRRTPLSCGCPSALRQSQVVGEFNLLALSGDRPCCCLTLLASTRVNFAGRRSRNTRGMERCAICFISLIIVLLLPGRDGGSCLHFINTLANISIIIETTKKNGRKMIK